MCRCDIKEPILLEIELDERRELLKPSSLQILDLVVRQDQSLYRTCLVDQLTGVHIGERIVVQQS